MLGVGSHCQTLKRSLQSYDSDDIFDFDSTDMRPRRAVRAPTPFDPDDEQAFPKQTKKRGSTGTPKMSKRHAKTKRKKIEAKSTHLKHPDQNEDSEQGLAYTADNYLKHYDQGKNLVFQSLDNGEFGQITTEDVTLLNAISERTSCGALNFVHDNLSPMRQSHLDTPTHTPLVDLQGESPNDLIAILDLLQEHAKNSASDNGQCSLVHQIHQVVQLLGVDPFQRYLYKPLPILMDKQPDRLLEEMTLLDRQANRTDALSLNVLDKLNVQMVCELLVQPMKDELAMAERCLKILHGNKRGSTPYRTNEALRPSLAAVIRAERAPSYVRKRYRGGDTPVYSLSSTQTGMLVDAFDPCLGTWIPAVILDCRERSSRHKDVKVLLCHSSIKPLLTRIRLHGLDYHVNVKAMQDVTHACFWVSCTDKFVATMGTHVSHAIHKRLFSEQEISSMALAFHGKHAL